jgi:hypothetical protein
MNIFDMVSNIYDADLLVTVQDYGSLEKVSVYDDDTEEEEFFRWFVSKVNNA